MATPGPRKIAKYGADFKIRAVELSNAPGALVKDVAESLCLHPFMLSRWRKQVRDGVLVASSPSEPTIEPAALRACAEMVELRELQARYTRLEQEHDLLKKLIRFASSNQVKPSASSKQTAAAPACGACAPTCTSPGKASTPGDDASLGAPSVPPTMRS